MAVRQPWFLSQAAWAFIAALLLVIAAAGYTVFSEWMNTVARAAWEYSALMPVIRFLGLEIGLSPLLQWVVIPPLALWLAKVLPQDGAERRARVLL